MVTNLKMNNDLSRRERKKRRTRQRLMKAALRLFSAHGYDGATIKQITQAADVAKSTFFNYFETKEAILPVLVEWQLQELKKALLPEQGAPASPVARIKLALRLVAEVPLADPALMRRIFAAKRDHPDIQPVHHMLTHLLAEQVRQAQAAGEIQADLDPLYLGSLIRALFFQQVMMQYCGYHSTPLPDMIEATIDLMLDGIAGPRWRQRT